MENCLVRHVMGFPRLHHIYIIYIYIYIYIYWFCTFLFHFYTTNLFRVACTTLIRCYELKCFPPGQKGTKRVMGKLGAVARRDASLRACCYAQRGTLRQPTGPVGKHFRTAHHESLFSKSRPMGLKSTCCWEETFFCVCI